MDALTAIKAVALGVVEGVTEFLPVSSTGHLIIVEQFLRLSPDAAFVAAFEVVIQLGAILAVVVLYWGTLWPWASPPDGRTRVWKLWLRVAVGIVPAFVAGFALRDFVTEHLFKPLVVSIALVLYGVVLILVERWFRRETPRVRPAPEISSLPLAGALAIGLFQALSLVPGTSRAAVSIIGGMILGLSRGAAAEFSFFLAVPVMVGASGLTLLKEGAALNGGQWLVLAIGFVVACLSALLVVRAFVGYLRKHDFVVFGWYRIVLGLLVALLLAR